MEIVLGILAAAAAAGVAWGCWRLGSLLAARLGKGAGEGVAAAALCFTLLLVWRARWHSADFPVAWVLSPLVYLEFAYFLPTLALFFGVAAGRMPRPETRRAIAALTAVVAGYAGIHLFLTVDARTLPMLSAAPPPGPVQAQTTGWSCGAASCVTLLRAHGIAATEREMGELCLTLPHRGTTLPRFVRGLTLKLRREGSSLRVVARDDLRVADLDTLPLPALLGIRGSFLVGHAVVLLRREGDVFLVADPLEGGKIHRVAGPDLGGRLAGDAVTLEK